MTFQPEPLPPFADVVQIRKDVAVGLMATERLTTTEAAVQHRYVRSAAGGYTEEYDPALSPYLIEPADAYNRRDTGVIIFVGSAQSGKTTHLVENTTVWSVMIDPADELIVAPSELMARDLSRRKIEPMNRDCPELARRLSGARSGDNILEKRYLGMILTIAWPTVSQLSMRAIARVKLTDYDRFKSSVGEEGEPFDLARKRTQTLGRKAKVLVEGSTGRRVIDPTWKPTTPHEAPPTTGILGLYNDGDRRRWYWPCSSCNDFFEGSFARLEWDQDNPDLVAASESVVMVCPSCGFPIEPKHKGAMNAAGIWVPEFQDVKDGKLIGPAPKNRTRSYWQKGPSAGWQDWKDLVLRQLQAEQTYERTGNEEKLRVTYNVDQAEVYIEKAARRDSDLQAADLAERVEAFPMREVPPGVRFLTFMVDVQKQSFEVLVRGWGADLESWLIDRFQVYERADGGLIDPAKRKQDWDLLIAAVLELSYPLRGDTAGRHMKVYKGGCDSGGRPGVTAQAYAFWRRLRKAGIHRRLILTKGDVRMAARWQVTYPDNRTRSDRKAMAQGDVPVLRFQANMLKDELSNQLEVTTPGQLFVHLPAALTAGEPPYPVLEQMTAEVRQKDGTWQKKSPKVENEALDLMVGCHAVALGLKIEKLDWDAPPAWAADWDANSHVIGAPGAERDRRVDDTPALPARRSRPNFGTDI